MENQTNFKNEELTKSQEFTLVYSGPSFENGIKIENFIENLKSLRELINNVADISLEHKRGYNSSKTIDEIKIIPSKGSIIEQITIAFQNPEIRGLVLNFFMALFFYLLGKKDSAKFEKHVEERMDEIEDLISRGQLKNIKKLYEPLEEDKDNFKILENNAIKLEVNFFQKEQINEAIKKAEEEIKFEETIEEHEGYISAIDIDHKRFRFHRIGDEQSYPLESKLSLSTITSLIAKPLKARLIVKKYKNKIRKFGLIEYKNLQKNIDEFVK